MKKWKVFSGVGALVLLAMIPLLINWKTEYEFRHPDYLVSDRIAPESGTEWDDVNIPNNQYQSGRSAREVLEAIQTFDQEAVSVVYVFEGWATERGKSLTFTKSQNAEVVARLTEEIYGKTYDIVSYQSAKITAEEYDYYMIFYDQNMQPLSMIFLLDPMRPVEHRSSINSERPLMVSDGALFSPSASFDLSVLDEYFDARGEEIKKGRALPIDPIP